MLNAGPILLHVRRIAAIVRLRPFDVSTPAGRSQERYRRAALAAMAQIIGKAISLASLFISVPLALHYLHEERYGVWMTISSIAVLLGFADLGVTTGLINAIAQAHGADDRERARSYVSSGLLMLVSVAGVILALLAVIYPLVPWPGLFKTQSELAARECGPAVAAFVICTTLYLPLCIGQSIRLGYQQGFANALWQCAGSSLSLIFLLVALLAHAGLPWLIVAMHSGSMLTAAANTFSLIIFERPWLRPSVRSLNAASALRLLQTGAMFMVVQTAAAVGYQTDALIINWLFGPAAVARFAVPARLFWLIPMLLYMLLNPLWPAYGEAFARGDVPWVRKTLLRSLRVALVLGVPASAALVLGGKWFIRVWTGDLNITPSWPLLIAFGLWSVSNVVTGAVAMLLNGANRMRFNMTVHALMAVVNVGLSIALAKAVGLAGVLYGTVLSQVIVILIPSAIYVPRLLARLEQERKDPPPEQPFATTLAPVTAQ